jgi:hypothetical protein
MDMIVIEAEGLMRRSDRFDDVIEIIWKRAGDPLTAAL